MLGINTPVTWKTYLTGKPDAVKRSLHTEAERLEGASKDDFLRVLPTLESLMELNARNQYEISLAANGDKDHLAVILMSSQATHVS